MALPMIGTWTVTVNELRPFTIHGDEYVELHVTNRDDSSDHLIRVPRHAAAAPVAAGNRLIITFLMGQVTEVRQA